MDKYYYFAYESSDSYSKKTGWRAGKMDPFEFMASEIKRGSDIRITFFQEITEAQFQQLKEVS